MKGNPMARNFGIGKHGINTNKHTAGISKPTATVKRDEDNTDLADGKSGSSPFQKAGDGYGGPEKASPAKGLLGDKWKDAKSKVRRAKEKVGEYAAGAKAYVKELVADKGYKGSVSKGSGLKDPGGAASDARKKVQDKNTGKKGLSYENQNRKTDPAKMKTAMVANYNKKKKADARAAAKAAKKKKDAAYAKKHKSFAGNL